MKWGEGEGRHSHLYVEYLNEALALTEVVDRIVYSGRTRSQTVHVQDTRPFGRCLVLDGKTQSSEADEWLYHEALVHPPMTLAANPRRVLVCGGGEGATLREVLRYRSVAKCTMVDIDGEVVDLCRQYLPNHHQGAFDDPRAELVIGDARKYVQETDERFDVIICDLADPMDGGPAYLLYTSEFYRMVHDRLSPGGVFVTQSGPGGLLNHGEVFTAINKTLAQVFPRVMPATTFMPSFGLVWSFTMAQRDPLPAPLSDIETDGRIEERLAPHALRYYDSVTHRHMYSLPKFLRTALQAETRIIRDGSPLYVFS